MIRISLGNVGSGKTANEVREMSLNRNNKKYYSNIIAKIDNVIELKNEMIVKREVVDTKKKRNGSVEEVTKLTLNVDYWKSITEPINIVLDEAHSIVNSRRSMSKLNIIVTEWLALIRRVLGQSTSGYGELVFITQLPNRIDTIAREMATQVRYHKCHYIMTCLKCGYSFREHSDTPERQQYCPLCSSYNMKKHSHIIEIWHFTNMDNYTRWHYYDEKTFYKHYLVRDIEKYFPLYDTLQWENMFNDLY